jgi:hypothetical protein
MTRMFMVRKLVLWPSGLKYHFALVSPTGFYARMRWELKNGFRKISGRSDRAYETPLGYFFNATAYRRAGRDGCDRMRVRSLPNNFVHLQSVFVASGIGCFAKNPG